MPDNVKAETVISVTALTVSVFGFFMPPVQEVRKAYREEKSDEVTSGALLAGGVVVGSAIIAAALSGNWKRVAISAMAVMVFAAIYFYQLGDFDNGIPSFQGIFPTR